MMDDFQTIEQFPKGERNKLRWLIRHAPENHMVEDGVAVLYGRQWLVNKARLPDFLRKQTLAAISKRAKRRGRAAAEPSAA